VKNRGMKKTLKKKEIKKKKKSWLKIDSNCKFSQSSGTPTVACVRKFDSEKKVHTLAPDKSGNLRANKKKKKSKLSFWSGSCN
jgi:hypothetical protein